MLETVDSADTCAPSPTPVTQGAYDRPLTNGSAALDPALDRGSEPAPGAAPAVTEPTRGLDSAVTKSLVLRLIAGVRGL